METEDKAKPIAELADRAELLRRRDFLKSLKKWSLAVIGGVVLGATLPGSETEAGWLNNRGGGGWINGGGGGWLNGRGGGGWLNAR